MPDTIDVKDNSINLVPKVPRRRVGDVTDYHFCSTIDTPRTERMDLYIGDIYVNAAVCKSCGDIVRSKNKHHYCTCKCGKLSVDGGSHYIKRSGEIKNHQNIIVLYADVPKE